MGGEGDDKIDFEHVKSQMPVEHLSKRWPMAN